MICYHPVVRQTIGLTLISESVINKIMNKNKNKNTAAESNLILTVSSQHISHCITVRPISLFTSYRLLR
jgi:hypothetical protein